MSNKTFLKCTGLAVLLIVIGAGLQFTQLSMVGVFVALAGIALLIVDFFIW